MNAMWCPENTRQGRLGTGRPFRHWAQGGERCVDFVYFARTNQGWSCRLSLAYDLAFIFEIVGHDGSRMWRAAHFGALAAYQITIDFLVNPNAVLTRVFAAHRIHNPQSTFTCTSPYSQFQENHRTCITFTFSAENALNSNFLSLACHI